jgi:hypothetical protein
VEEIFESTINQNKIFNAIEKFTNQVSDKINEFSQLYREGERTTYAVIHGYHKGWSFEKTCSYYSLPKDIADIIWNQMGFKTISKGGEQVSTNTKSKQNDILDYVKKNVGQVVTATQVSADVKISLPTFYNFVKANNQMFEKVKRGQFKIVSV